MKAKSVHVTKNYRMFERSAENRPLDINKHKKLLWSMKTYGFLACFPIVCFRNAKGQLIVKDGQHRLAVAEMLGKEVYWIEEEIDFDVAAINCTAKTWVLKDYALKHASNGRADYQRALNFAEEHKLSLGMAVALLAGTTTWNNIQSAFIDGSFRVKDSAWANAVAGIYGPMAGMADVLRNKRFLEACMAVCRVKGFDPHRLLHGASRCRDKLVGYSTRDAYLDMLETVYNFNRTKCVPLKHEAKMAMRKRNPAKPKKKSTGTEGDAA